jgi:putative sterol carrier protein
MTDVSENFLMELADDRFEPLLQKVMGTLVIRLLDGPEVHEWAVSVQKGAVSLRRGGGEADATLTVERPLFERIVRGEANAMTAVLRGAARIAGDLDLLMAVQRLFPGPDDLHSRREASGQ